MLIPERRKKTLPADASGTNRQSQWLRRLTIRLAHWERKQSISQKKVGLLCFSLIVGAYFLHLAISAAVSDGREFIKPRQTLRPPPALAPPPPSADSIQNLNLLP